MSEKVFFKNQKGQKLCGIIEKNNDDKHIVLIIHGNSSNKDAASAKLLSEELNKRNINSFRIDLDGCGESEGDFAEQTISSTISDTEAAVGFIIERGYKTFDIFGSSGGGTTALGYALNHKDVRKIGLLAPVSDYPNQRLDYHGKEYMDEWKEKGYTYINKRDGRKLKVNYSFIEDAYKYIIFDKAKDISQPVLIIHGTEDKSVNIEDSRKTAKLLPKGKLVELEGADHTFHNLGEREEANRLLADFFQS